MSDNNRKNDDGDDDDNNNNHQRPSSSPSSSASSYLLSSASQFSHTQNKEKSHLKTYHTYLHLLFGKEKKLIKIVRQMVSLLIVERESNLNAFYFF